MRTSTHMLALFLTTACGEAPDPCTETGRPALVACLRSLGCDPEALAPETTPAPAEVAALLPGSWSKAEAREWEARTEWNPETQHREPIYVEVQERGEWRRELCYEPTMPTLTAAMEWEIDAGEQTGPEEWRGAARVRIGDGDMQPGEWKIAVVGAETALLAGVGGGWTVESASVAALVLRERDACCSPRRAFFERR